MNAFHRWFCRSDFWRRTLESKLLPWALHNVDPGRHLLEIGAGPGLVTEYLRGGAAEVTALEIDSKLATALGERMRNTTVRVVQGDGTKLPFADQSFTGAVCFTMLHHIPKRGLQDLLLAEVHRVLKPGGVFVGSDSRSSVAMRIIHIGDTMNIVDPSTFGQRLAAAGFTDVRVDAVSRAFRFRARA